MGSKSHSAVGNRVRQSKAADTGTPSPSETELTNKGGVVDLLLSKVEICKQAAALSSQLGRHKLLAGTALLSCSEERRYLLSVDLVITE